MSDEQYTEDQVLEATQEAVEQETVEAPAQDTVEEVAEEAVTEDAASEEAATEDAASDEEAPASSEEEAIAKLRRKLYTSPGDWYVIHTYSGHERKVKANLEQRITTKTISSASRSRTSTSWSTAAPPRSACATCVSPAT